MSLIEHIDIFTAATTTHILSTLPGTLVEAVAHNGAVNHVGATIYATGTTDADGGASLTIDPPRVYCLRVNGVVSDTDHYYGQGIRPSPPTLVVAANDASLLSKAWADYLCPGTNDATIINQALAVGVNVTLTEGTFDIDATLILGSNMIFQGAGWSTKLIQAANTNAAVVEANNKSNVFVKDMLIDGNSANQGGTGMPGSIHNLLFEGCTNAFAINIYAKNAQKGGIAMATTTNGWITNCLATDGGLEDYYITTGSHNIHVIDCIATSLSAQSVGLEIKNQAYDIEVTNFQASDCNQSIHIWHSVDGPPHDITINGGRITGDLRQGVVVNGAAGNLIYGISISGLTVRDCGKNIAHTYDGISVTYVIDARVENCKSYDSLGAAGTQRRAISLASTVDRAIVIGNDFTDNFWGPSLLATELIAHSNLGYKTEAKGIAAVLRNGAATTQNWPHGLVTAPTLVLITPQEAGSAAAQAYIPAAQIGTTNFQIGFTATALSTAALGQAIADDGGSLVNETTAANNGTANDMNLLPAVPAVNDAYYFMATEIPGGVRVNIGTQGVGTWTITWEYSNSAGTYSALAGVTDGTTSFTAAAGNRDVTFTMPTNWGKVTVNGYLGYAIRARVSAYTAVTTQPLGTQAWILEAMHYLWKAEV